MKIFKRKPDFIIGSLDNPYLLRWYIIPRNRFFNIYLHKFCRSDDDRALHDHPWVSCSIILKGGYQEHTPDGIFKRTPAGIYFRKATQAHRVELHRAWGIKRTWCEVCSCCHEFHESDAIEIPAWTIFITGPKVREWGFHCPKGWRHWRDFVSVHEGDAKGNEVGRGCE